MFARQLASGLRRDSDVGWADRLLPLQRLLLEPCDHAGVPCGVQARGGADVRSERTGRQGARAGVMSGTEVPRGLKSAPQVLAVDFGGTKTGLALVESGGVLAGKKKEPAERSLEGTVRQIVAAAERTRPGAIGIVVPGIYDPGDGTAWAPNLWGRDHVPLRAMLAGRLAVPVTIDSDRAGYVAGEQWMGVARALRDVVFMAVGTGIGVGIISGGQLLSGAHGIAGAA